LKGPSPQKIIEREEDFRRTQQFKKIKPYISTQKLVGPDLNEQVVNYQTTRSRKYAF